MATYYVDSENGSDTFGTGAIDAPFKTISYGILNATDFSDGYAYVAVKHTSNPNLGYDSTIRNIEVDIDSGLTTGTFIGTDLTLQDIGKIMYDGVYARRITNVIPATNFFEVESTFDVSGIDIGVAIYNQPYPFWVINSHTSVSAGYRLLVVGYKETFNEETGVSDMDVDQPYGQDPYDAYVNGVDTDRCIELTADPTLVSDFVRIQTVYIQLRNFYIHGTAVGADLLNMNHANAQYTDFYNCKFGKTGNYIVYDWYTGAAGARRGIIFTKCYLDHQNPALSGVHAAGASCVIFDGCVFNGQDHPSDGWNFTIIVAGLSQVAVCDSYFYNGDAGIYPGTGAHAYVKNCTFWGQKKVCVAASGAIIHATNNVICPRPGGAHLGSGVPSGSVVSDYNIFWSTDNIPPTNFWLSLAAVIPSPIGLHSIVANPQIRYKQGIGYIAMGPEARQLRAGTNIDAVLYNRGTLANGDNRLL